MWSRCRESHGRPGILSGTLSARQRLLAATGQLVDLPALMDVDAARSHAPQWVAARARAMLHCDKPPSLFFYVAIWNRGVSDPKEHSKPPFPEVCLPPARYLVLRSGRRLHFPCVSGRLSLGPSITPHCASLGASWKSPSMAKETGLGIWRAGTSAQSRVLFLEGDANSSRHHFGNLA